MAVKEMRINAVIYPFVDKTGTTRNYQHISDVRDHHDDEPGNV
ncbi:MAG: hypothetical protein ABGY96_25045 [bacterium]